MMVTMPGREEGEQITHDELGTLKFLATEGGVKHRFEISCSQIGEALDISVQTASRRLRALQNKELIVRDPTDGGQQVYITATGQQLLKRQKAEYDFIFSSNTVTFEGVLQSGLGKGKHFISLDGYNKQFRSKLGYEPFTGTLNVGEVSDTRERLSTLEPVVIDEWTDGETAYGAVECYPGLLKSGNDSCFVHALNPLRTDHDSTVIEVIAPENLRSALDLTDGDTVLVEVGENSP